MGWIESAAIRAREEKVEKEKAHTYSLEIHEHFLEHYEDLWMKFSTILEEIQENFKEDCSVQKKDGTQLVITIALVVITINAVKKNLTEHYHGEAYIEYSCSHNPGKPQLAVESLYLNPIDHPVWMYKMEQNGKEVDVPFSEIEAEDVIKTALWKYIQ